MTVKGEPRIQPSDSLADIHVPQDFCMGAKDLVR